MFFGRGVTWLLTPGYLALIALSLAFAILEEKRSALARFGRMPVPVQVVALTVLLLCFELFSVTDERLPFIYFQF